MPSLSFHAPGTRTWHGSRAERTTHAIPKTIWTFWDSPPHPRTVQACLRTWRQSNPDYELVLVSDASIHQYVQAVPAHFNAWQPAHRSDWVRLALLERYGGIWIDGTSLVFSSLDFLSALQQRDGTELVAYYNGGRTENPDYPMMENWILAAVENSPFTARWKTVFERLVDLSDQAYLDALGMPLENILQGFSHNPRYFAMHAAAQQLMRGEQPVSLSLIPAEEDALKPAFVRDGDTDAIVDWLCHDTATQFDFRVFKMPGLIWRALEQRLEAGLVLPTSIIGRYLNDPTMNDPAVHAGRPSDRETAASGTEA